MKISLRSSRRSASFRWDDAAAFRVFLIVLAARLLIPATACRADGPAKVPVYTLEDCLALARKQNPDVLVAAKRVDAARANVTAARAPVYPSLTTNGYYQYREQSLTSAGGENANTRKDDYFGTARVTQNVYSAGQVRNRIAAAKLQADAENDTFLAQVDAQSSVQTAYVALAQLLGVAYPEDARTRPFRVRGELSCPPMRLTLAECLGRAQALRPEIVARKLAVDAFRHQITAEKAGTRPQVSAFASYDIYSEPSLLSVRDNFSGYTVGVQATWNVFDGFATRGRVRSAQAQQGQAEAQLQATRQQVEAEVRTAFYDLQDAANSLRPLGENIGRANEGVSLSVSNFDAGSATQLDVLQTRINLTNSRLIELGVRLRYHNALARLERAMGLGRPAQGSVTTLPATRK